MSRQSASVSKAPEIAAEWRPLAEPAEIREPDRQPRGPKIAQGLVLVFFVAAVPAVFLAVLIHAELLELTWRNPLLNTVLLWCSAALCLLVTYWLSEEARHRN